MIQKDQQPVPGLTNKLHTAVANLVQEFYAERKAPTRALIMGRLRTDHPELIHPKVELPVALLLNRWVEDKFMVREGGKFYFPGERLLKGEPE